ncbi:MAG: hypothetical protein KDK99_11115 [Verrucomicrobiales bacterium]|nr:hypothetical protein [Verrucomicrobiales bacterium]
MAAPSHSLRSWLVYGALRGAVLSLVGFLPWVLAGRTLSQSLGEAGFYAVCALVFIAASGPLLHGLLRGGGIGKFYALFALSFALYAVGWTAGWLALRGIAGSALGLVLGCLGMAATFAVWFRKPLALVPMLLMLLLTQVLGYFVGQFAHNVLAASPNAAKLAWGAAYGVGLGLGMAAALWRAQRPDPVVR